MSNDVDLAKRVAARWADEFNHAEERTDDEAYILAVFIGRGFLANPKAGIAGVVEYGDGDLMSYTDADRFLAEMVESGALRPLRKCEVCGGIAADFCSSCGSEQDPFPEPS